MLQNDLLSLDYDPLIFLRCHSKSDKDCADVRTQIWQVAFNPNQADLIATCGGNKVCVIDLSIPKVEHRYSAKNEESFFALMWLSQSTSSVLTAGGDMGVLYFISLEMKRQVASFQVPKTSKSNIYSLTPFPSRKNSFFCAMSSGDIHFIEADVQFDSHSKINIISSFSCNGEITRTAFCHYAATLLAATSTGLYGWTTCSDNYEDWGNKVITFNIRTNSEDLNTEDKIVDSIEVLDDGYLAAKYALHSYIYIWHAQHSVAKVNKETRVLEIVPLYKLEWCETDNYYMEIGSNCDLGLLTCGDNKGNIWFYDIRCLSTHVEQDFSAEPKVIKAFKVLDWPQVDDIHHAKSKKLGLQIDDIVIGKAVVGPDGKYCVAITDRNVVCLWSLIE